MTYFANWEEFSKAVEKLWAASGERCRFVLSYDHKSATLSAKLTDDQVCLQYTTSQQTDLNRLHKLQGELLRRIVHP